MRRFSLSSSFSSCSCSSCHVIQHNNPREDSWKSWMVPSYLYIVSYLCIFFFWKKIYICIFFFEMPIYKCIFFLKKPIYSMYFFWNESATIQLTGWEKCFELVLLKSNNDFHYFCLQFFCRVWAKTKEKVRNHESLYEYFYFHTSSFEDVHAPIKRHFHRILSRSAVQPRRCTRQALADAQRRGCGGVYTPLCSRTSLRIEGRSALKSALKSRF